MFNIGKDNYFLALILSLALNCLSATTSPYGNLPKSIKANKVIRQIQLDGILDEMEWKHVEPAVDFIQREPEVGAASRFNTEVYIQYNDHYIFIGAKLFDPEPKKILKELSLRDQTGNADLFSVFFDPFLSGLNGFQFGVTASGVQYDAIVSEHDEDLSWNAVWDSKVNMQEYGWSVEMKIPYSAIRFPSKASQEWGIQYSREIRRFRETSTWNFIDPTIDGWVQQSGRLTQIEKIEAPVRLSLTPYLSAYLNVDTDPERSETKTQTEFAYGAGLDLKYGLSDAFTLDMTLIPDFGQVISDRKVLNLSPFEVYFEENRQFFTEGIELFDRGDIFYSRRVGGTPLNYNKVASNINSNETIIENPEVSSLINATKISGRTNKGTGMGFFNAVVAREYALIRNDSSSIPDRKIETNPLTNYNAVVFDQNLKNNSFVSLMNTHVWREGQAYDANVTAGFFNLRSNNQKYFVEGDLGLSNRYFEKTSTGEKLYLSAGKGSGNWTYDLSYSYISDDFNVNDFGFLFSFNERTFGGSLQYEQWKPSNPKIQFVRIQHETTYEQLAKQGSFSDFYSEFSSFVLYKSRFAYGINVRLEPVDTRDYFEPRTFDFIHYLLWPSNYSLGGFISSDYRKAFALDLNANFRYFNTVERNIFNIGFLPRIRFNDHFSIQGNFRFNSFHFEPGWVNKTFIKKPVDGLTGKDILIGIRDRYSYDNSLTLKYNFTATMGINMRIRHYYDKVLYDRFGVLQKDGQINILNFNGRNEQGDPVFDQQLNIFNVDLQYQWRFAPGSDIFIVWKNEIIYQNDKFSQSYFDNLGDLFDQGQGNSISLRILYYLDYLQFAKK